MDSEAREKLDHTLQVCVPDRLVVALREEATRRMIRPSVVARIALMQALGLTRKRGRSHSQSKRNRPGG